MGGRGGRGGGGRGASTPGRRAPQGEPGGGPGRGAAAFLAGAWVPGTTRKAGPSMLRAWGTRRRRDLPLSLPLCIYKRVPLYLYLTVGARECVCAVCVCSACVCVCVGPPCEGAATVRPGGSRGRCVCVVTSYLSSPSLYFTEGWHFGGVGNKVDIKGHFSCSALSGLWTSGRQSLAFPLPSASDLTRS